ncbi:unnamed protein product [Enterobius vermicularis]|uniref:ANK_REP_REGION domain-containing protein n=1 Tax=Enterobius vermicularis TaxID=51028 RepID=A0A0N4UST5_ENTVE|nr:unnamed protein product [Enterobius vermicularis]
MRKQYTTLRSAAFKGHLALVKRLLVVGTSINARNARKHSPRNASPYFLFLLQSGVTAGNASKWTQLHIAAYNGHLDPVKHLLAVGADVNATDTQKWTPLHLAANKGHLDVVKQLLAVGADVNAREEDHWTPLHLAAENGHSEVVEQLLGVGADVNASNKRKVGKKLKFS